MPKNRVFGRSGGGVKSKQEFDRLREKYKIHISESELRMWKTDNTLGNVR